MYGLCLAEGVGGEGCFVCFELQGAFLPPVPPRWGLGRERWLQSPLPFTAAADGPWPPPPLPQQPASLFVSQSMEL